MESVRIRLRLPFVIMAFVSFVLFLGGQLVISAIVLALAPLHVSIWVALGCVVFTSALGDGSKIRLVRGDTAGIDELMETLPERLGERWTKVMAR